MRIYKRILFIALPLAVGAASFSVHRLNSDPGRGSGEANVPVLDCPSVIDLGEQELGVVAVGRFTLANTGGRELTVHDVQPSQCCTSLDILQEGEIRTVGDLRVAPGDNRQLSLRVSVRGPAGGPQRASVRFRTNDPSRPEFRLEAVVPHVRGGVTIDPTELNLGELVVGSETRRTVRVLNEGVRECRVDSVGCTAGEGLTARLVESPAAAALIGTIEVTARPAAAGSVNGVITVHTSGGAGRPVVEVPIRGVAVPPVVVSPSVLVLPRASGAGRLDFADCVCRSPNAKRFELAVDSVDKGLAVEILPAAPNAAFQAVRVRLAGPQPGVSAGELLHARLTAKAGDVITPLTISVRYSGGES